MFKLTPEQQAQLIEILTAEVGDHEEDGPNRGTCEKYQKAGRGVDGDSWCMDLILWGLDQVTGGQCPLPRSGSTEEQRAAARKRGELTTEPGYCYVGLVISYSTGKAHHAFLVTSAADDYGTYESIAGNTNNNGSRDGTGVYWKTRGKGDGLRYEYFPI